jgi:hypothetical protein
MYEVRTTKSPTDLPFVGRTKSKKSLSFWVPPPAKDFSEGAVVGAEMATAYSNYLQGAVDMPPVLAQIVIDMIDGALPAGVHGQLVGFLSTVEQHLVVKTTKKRG